MFPCTSYEQALEKAKEHVNRCIEETKDNPSSRVIDSAKSLGVAVPDYYINLFNERLKASIEKDIQTIKKSLEYKKNALQSIFKQRRN